MGQQIDIFNDLERTFATPGWEHLQRMFREEQEQIPLHAFLNADSWEELERLRIRFELLTQLIELPEQIKAEREAVESEESV